MFTNLFIETVLERSTQTYMLIKLFTNDVDEFVHEYIQNRL